MRVHRGRLAKWMNGHNAVSVSCSTARTATVGFSRLIGLSRLLELSGLFDSSKVEGIRCHVVNTEGARGEAKAARQQGSLVAGAYEAFPDASDPPQH